MSASRALQKALHTQLGADAGVTALVAGRVYDNPPTDAAFPFLSFGPSDWREDDANCITARSETIQIDAWSRDQGKLHPCRALVDAVYDALHDASLTLDEPYALASLRVVLARVFQDPDGLTAHGVVQVTALIEDAG